jgi:hypothetical protein
MGSLKNALAVIVGLLALGYGIYQFYLFVNSGEVGGSHHLWFAIGGAAIAFVCGLVYFLGRVNKEEEIHITQ